MLPSIYFDLEFVTNDIADSAVGGGFATWSLETSAGKEEASPTSVLMSLVQEGPESVFAKLTMINLSVMSSVKSTVPSDTVPAIKIVSQ